MSTYTFLPQGFTNWQDSPQPPIPPHPSFPGGVSFPVGFDQRGWAEMACRGGMQDGETPPDPRKRMAPFSTFHERQSLLEVLVIFQDNVRNNPSLSCQVFPFPLWHGGDAQAEDKCVPDPGQFCFSNSLKQSWPWGSKGRMKGVTAGRAWREATASRARTRKWQQCIQTQDVSFNDATAGIFWARL